MWKEGHPVDSAPDMGPEHSLSVTLQSWPRDNIFMALSI